MSTLHRFKKIRYKQYICVLIVGILQTTVSMTSAWITPVLPWLLSEDTPLDAPLTNTEETWLVSVEQIGAIVGSLLAAVFTDVIGRKLVLLISPFPYIIGLTAIAFTKSPVGVIILNSFVGISTGIILTIAPLYIAEVSDKDIRGRLGIIQLILSSFGKIYVYSVSPYISYFALTLSVGIFPLVFVVLFSFMPETPHFLLKKRKIKSAHKSLKQLSVNDLSDHELAYKLKEIQEYVDKHVTNKSSLIQLVFDPCNRRALFIAWALKTLLALSGVLVLLSYLQKLVDESGSSISPEVSSIILSAINLPSALVAVFLIDKLGRRPIYYISCCGCVVASLTLGTYFYLKEVGDVSDVLWIPTTCLCVYIILANLGINLVGDVVLGEIFSMNVKSVASSLSLIYAFTINFFVFRFFQPIADEVGIYTVFWILSVVSVFGFLFSIFVLPETKKKTFLEIQMQLNKKMTNVPTTD
ncbi:hypothetical protein FQR65_LT03285 [Abscondita terminalis]|nr:hypothetical protein FQR65_LT03285 [Abscondita terminalis]